MNLKHLNDNVLLSETKSLVSKERESSLHVLYHLREIERRRLFSELGYASLFDYAVRELKYSAAAAMRRINSARLLEEVPELKTKIEEGHLTLTNLSQASQFFKNEKIINPNVKKKVLELLENKTSRECEKQLGELSSAHNFHQHLIRMKVSEGTYLKFNELKNMIAHQRTDDDSILDFMVDHSLKEAKSLKFKVDTVLRSAPVSPGVTRYIAASIKKAVYERDGGKCTNCHSTYKLEYDHIKPYSHGGLSSFENLRLLCFSCNQRRIKNSSSHISKTNNSL